ncbi:MAG TPA: phosphatidate cytidylyltransferase [Gammaproteobacteria bacterium]
MLRTRVLTGIVLAAVVGFTVLGLDTTNASLVFGLFWLIGADEWARLMRLGPLGRAVFDAVFVGFVAVVVGMGLPGAAVNAVFWLAVLVWLVMFGLVLRFPERLPLGLLTVAGLVVLAAAWLSFYRVHGGADDGPLMILFALMIVWSADIGAFFVGRQFGRTPLAPRVSPKKTWEGVGGGVVLATAAGILAATILELPLARLALLAALMALVSVIGDLGISMLKRRAGLKDAGVLLPGHGGILDRFDGVTAALPVFVLGLQFAHVLD